MWMLSGSSAQMPQPPKHEEYCQNVGKRREAPKKGKSPPTNNQRGAKNYKDSGGKHKKRTKNRTKDYGDGL
jgi:hypothetical protein